MSTPRSAALAASVGISGPTPFSTPVPLLSSSSNRHHHHEDALNSSRNLLSVTEHHIAPANVKWKLTLPSLTGALKLNYTGARKTANQRVEEILVQAESNSKKSAHFWDDPRRRGKGARLAKLYNGNMDDPLIKRSVRQSHDEATPGDPGSTLQSISSLDDLASANSTALNRTAIPYHPRHLTTALEKLKLAASRYDEHAAHALKSCLEKVMYPDVLHDLIFRTFMVKLQLPECQAVIDHFDRDGSGILDYSEFLNCFLRLSFEQKGIARIDSEYTANKIRAKLEDFDRKASDKFASTTVVTLDTTYNAAHLHSALDKVAIVSCQYDRAKNPSMASLDSRLMDVTGFKQQLYRMFNIRLHKKELSALFEYFDQDSGGHVDMSEFMISFFQLAGRGEAALLRQKEGLTGKQIADHVAKNIKANDNKAAARAMNHIRGMANAGKAKFDLKAAFDHFDKDKSGSINLEELEEVVMEMCKGRIAASEVACVIKLFDPNGDGDVKYDEFAYSFYNRRGVTQDDDDDDERRILERIEVRKEEREAEEAVPTTVQVKHKQKEIKMTPQMIKTAVHVMDQVRQRTAKMSLKEAFNHFDTDGSGNINHEELTTAIREVSGKRLSHQEQLAIIAMFDPNNDGEVAYDEFCWTFYNRRSSVKKMEEKMKMQLAAVRVKVKVQAHHEEQKKQAAARELEFLPPVHFGESDAAATKTAKIATTLISSLQKNNKIIKASSMRQSKGATLIRCVTPPAVAQTGQSTQTVAREFKARVLRYDMKWVALKELSGLLFRRSMRNKQFIEEMHEYTFNCGHLSRKDFCLLMVESLADLNTNSHNRIFSCFDYANRDDVFIGEIAVALEFVSNTHSNLLKIVCELFGTLVEANFREPEPDTDMTSEEHRKSVVAMRKRSVSSGVTLGFEAIVQSFSTLCLQDKDSGVLAEKFRKAWVFQGMGAPPALAPKREQTITLGGQYQAVDNEQFKMIMCHSPALVECLEQQREKIVEAMNQAAGKAPVQTNLYNGERSVDANGALVGGKKKRNKTMRKVDRRRAATLGHLKGVQRMSKTHG